MAVWSPYIAYIVDSRRDQQRNNNSVKNKVVGESERLLIR